MLAFVLLFCSTQLGAVRRRLTVRSTPPGALVYIDDQYIGVTPVSTAFTYYGTRKIQIIKGGFETINVKKNIRPVWYQYPGIDFFAENLTTSEFRDERELDFTLEQQKIVPVDVLRDRGEQLRLQARQGAVAPIIGPAVPATAPPPGILVQPPPGQAFPAQSFPPPGAQIQPSQAPVPGAFPVAPLNPPSNSGLGAPIFVPQQPQPQPQFAPQPQFNPQPSVPITPPANNPPPGFGRTPSGAPRRFPAVEP